MGFLDNLLGNSNKKKPMKKESIIDKKPNIKLMESNRDIYGLINTLYHDDPKISEAASKSIYNLSNLLRAYHDAGAFSEINFGIPPEPLIDALKLDNMVIKGNLIDALRFWGDTKALYPLLEILLNEDDSSLSDNPPYIHALVALQHICENDVEILFQSLNVNSPIKQERVSLLISNILLPFSSNEQPDISSLIPFLSNSNPNVRITTLKTLHKLYENELRQNIHDQKIPWLFIKSLNDEDMYVKSVAIECIGDIEESRAIDPLIEIFNGENKLIQWKIAGALGFIEDEKHLDLIIPLLDEIIEDLTDKNSNMHEVSIYALNGISTIYKDERMINPVIKSLNDDKDDVRTAATIILGKIGNKKSVKPLIDVLNDKNELVKRNAIISLGQIGDRSAVDALIECLDDEDATIRSYTISSLEDIGDKRAILPLSNLLNDEKDYIREKVEKVLDKLSKADNFNYCECGAENAENAKFCQQCGTKLD